MFSICYLSDPKASRHDLEQRGYVNIGGFCPTGYCTLVLEPEHKGVFGLSTERHDGNLYGMLVEGSTSMCPRYVVKYVSNFTVIAVPKCSVIIDGARFPKKETTEPKKKSSDLKWFIAIGIVFALLLLVAGAVGLYICTHSKKEAVPVKPVRHNGSSPKSHPRTSPINKKLERRPDTVCCSPKTQPSYKENFGKTESKHNRNSQKPSLKSDKCSISDEV
uniref:SUEL-type lectin domain-containing protein n=2 Tax=Panagrellus redivivus TaxID=6233 RepID=A0A7E4UWE3_PANRE